MKRQYTKHMQVRVHAKGHFSKGFTAVELLVTLVMAALFLAAGYQLYGAILARSSESRWQSQADNIAVQYLRLYETTVQAPCVASTAFNQTIADATTLNMPNPVVVVVTYSCPNTAITLTKVTAQVSYGVGSTKGVVQHEILASAQ
jgi:prepilin-type N-terminal cleavage/methylation domain-containing protein